MTSLESNIARVAAYYAAQAPEYNTQYEIENIDAGYASLRQSYQSAFAGLDVLEIACGTGYWTRVVSSTARTVLATDLHLVLIEQTSQRLQSLPNVRCQVADAYTLDGVAGTFSGAFGQYWWSHIPVKMRKSFLTTLHAKLRPGALVMFTDNLEYHDSTVKRYTDEHGDVYEERLLRDGTRFETIKNFPSRSELAGLLDGISDDFHYVERDLPEVTPAGLWTVAYRVKADHSASSARNDG